MGTRNSSSRSPRPAPSSCIRWTTRWEQTWSTRSSMPPSRPPRNTSRRCSRARRSNHDARHPSGDSRTHPPCFAGDQTQRGAPLRPPDCGAAAHRYFIRWFLAWFLTQEIPLTFASLPYRGGRYTITSMYAFLNYKYYLGGSFAWWYWHYSMWGAVLTGLIEAACVAVLFLRPDPSEARHIRGVTLVSAR